MRTHSKHTQFLFRHSHPKTTQQNNSCSNLYFIKEIKNLLAVLCEVTKHLRIGKTLEKY